MDEEKAKEIWKRAYMISFKYRTLIDPEEYAQRVVLYLIENPKRKALIKHIIFDFLRQDFGDNRIENSKDKNQIPTEEKYLERLIHQNAIEDQFTPDFFDSYLSVLTPGNLSAMFQLYYIWEFTHAEIAQLFRVTTSRVTQIMGEIEQSFIESQGLVREKKKRGRKPNS